MRWSVSPDDPIDRPIRFDSIAFGFDSYLESVGVVHLIGDAAQIAVRDGRRDVDVTARTPVGVPRVSYDPVILIPIVTDELYAMIQLIVRVYTRRVVEDTGTRVILPRLRVHADRERSDLGELRAELVDRLIVAIVGAEWDRPRKVVDHRTDIRFVELTRTGRAATGRIRIRRLRIQTALSRHVFERGRRVTTLATLVTTTLVAIHNLLRRERLWVFGVLHDVHRLDALGGRESPARCGSVG